MQPAVSKAPGLVRANDLLHRLTLERDEREASSGRADAAVDHGEADGAADGAASSTGPKKRRAGHATPTVVHLPRSSRYWRDESLEWDRVKGRAALPPSDSPSMHLKGSAMQDAIYE